MSYLSKSGNENKKIKKNSTTNGSHLPDTCEIANYIFVALISIFLIIIPFYRGLYFRENYMPAIIYMGAVFVLYIIYKLKKKDYRLVSSYMDIAILTLPIAYFLSFLFAVNAKSAFDMVLKYIAYFMMYKVVADICGKHEKAKRIFSWSVLLSIYLVAISGMLTMAGIMDLKGVTEFNRLYGVYQYPNTTAAVLGAGVLLAIGLLSQTTNMTEKIYYQVVLTTIFAGFAFTLSVGGILVLGILVVFNFIIIDTKSKLDYLVNFIIVIAANMLLFMDYMKNALKGPFVLYYLLSLAIGLALQLLYNRYIQKQINRLSSKKIALILVLIVAFIVIVGVVALSVLGMSLPSLISKVFDADLKAQNASDRIIFLKDGLKMFSDSFLVGFGGGAWKDVYHKYQSFSYDSIEMHNYYVQLMVEVGILGALALLVVLALLTKNFLTSVIKRKNKAYLPFYMGILMLLGHAFIDFDLSLVAPMMLLWCLIGISASEFEDGFNLFNNKEKQIGIGAVVLGLMVLYFGASIYSGMINGNNAAKVLEEDTEKAVAMYEKAIQADRYNAAYRMDYAQIMLNNYLQSKNVEYYKKFERLMDDIAKYEPYEMKYIVMRISLLLRAGLVEEGMTMANRLVADRPLVESAYTMKLDVNYSIAKQYFETKQHEKAILYLDNMIAVEEQLEVAKSKSIKPFEVEKRVYDMIGLAKNWKENAERIIER